MPFTFKTEKSTGRYASFHPDYHAIKLSKKEVGCISDKYPYQIKLMVVKANANEDDNINCDWKWVKLKKQSESLKDAKEWLNANFETITSMYNIKKL